MTTAIRVLRPDAIGFTADEHEVRKLDDDVEEDNNNRWLLWRVGDQGELTIFQDSQFGGEEMLVTYASGTWSVVERLR